MFFIKNILTYVKNSVIYYLSINIKFFILRRDNMKNQAIEKINKIGKISYIISKIAKVVLIIGLVVALVGAVFCFVLPKNTVKADMSGKMNLELNFESLGLNEQDILDGLDEGELELKVQNIQFGSIETNSNIKIFEQDYKPLEVIQNDSTVVMNLETDSNSFTLRDVGLILIIASTALAMTIVTVYFVQALCKEFRDCNSPFEENVIKKMRNLAISLIPWTIISSIIESVLGSFMYGGLKLSISIDLGIVLVVLIVFVLIYIFKYGAVLQQESDETL